MGPQDRVRDRNLGRAPILLTRALSCSMGIAFGATAGTCASISVADLESAKKEVRISRLRCAGVRCLAPVTESSCAPQSPSPSFHDRVVGASLAGKSENTTHSLS